MNWQYMACVGLFLPLNKIYLTLPSGHKNEGKKQTANKNQFCENNLFLDIFPFFINTL